MSKDGDRELGGRVEGDIVGALEGMGQPRN